MIKLLAAYHRHDMHQFYWCDTPTGEVDFWDESEDPAEDWESINEIGRIESDLKTYSKAGHDSVSFMVDDRDVPLLAATYGNDLNYSDPNVYVVDYNMMCMISKYQTGYEAGIKSSFGLWWVNFGFIVVQTALSLAAGAVAGAKSVAGKAAKDIKLATIQGFEQIGVEVLAAPIVLERVSYIKNLVSGLFSEQFVEEVNQGFLSLVNFPSFLSEAISESLGDAAVDFGSTIIQSTFNPQQFGMLKKFSHKVRLYLNQVKYMQLTIGLPSSTVVPLLNNPNTYSAAFKILEAIQTGKITSTSQINTLIYMLNTDVTTFKSGGDKNFAHQFELLEKISEGEFLKYDNLQISPEKFTKMMHLSIAKICQTTQDVGNIIGLWWGLGGIDGYTRAQHIEFYKKGTNEIWAIRPIANKDGTQSLMMIVTRNGKVVEHLTQDLTFVPKGTGNRNFVEWLDAEFSYKMVDPIMGVHTRYPAIDIYRRVGRKRAAAEGLATLDGSLFHLSSDGRDLFSNNLRQITDLGALVTFDTRARLAIQEDPDDLGSWITSSSASSLTLVTLLQVSPNSDMSAREVYKDCLGYDSADLPLHVAYNQITIGDLRNPQVFSMILTHKLKLTTPQKMSFTTDKATNLVTRNEWLSNTWKTIAVINNKVQRMKLKGIKQPADTDGGSANIAIWDKFSQIKKLVYGGSPIKQSLGGFNSPWKAFQSVRTLAFTINSEFPGMGDVLMRGMFNRGANLDGWETWVLVDVNAAGGWSIFRKPQSIGNAQKLMNRFKTIAEMGSTSFYSKVMEGKKVLDLFAPKHLSLFINHFTECITQSTDLSVLTISRIEAWRDKNVKKYAALQYSDALLLNYATQYLSSLFTLTGLNFNNFMTDHVSDINAAWSWNPECRLDLSQYAGARTYFGAFNPQSRLEIPKLYGTELRSVLIDLDSDFEADVGRTTFEIEDGDITRTIPINSPNSPYTKWYGRQQIRHWSHSLSPTRKRIPEIDFASTDPITHMYYDIFLQLQEGRTFVIEIDGGTGREYMTRKDMNVYSYVMDWNIPIISVVRDNNFQYYLRRCLFIGHIAPLLKESDWTSLNTAMKYNRANDRLQFEEMLTDLFENWESYGLSSQNEAVHLQELFGMDIDGMIFPEFEAWWGAFRNSYIPKVGLMWYMTGYDLITGEPIYD